MATSPTRSPLDVRAEECPGCRDCIEWPPDSICKGSYWALRCSQCHDGDAGPSCSGADSHDPNCGGTCPPDPCQWCDATGYLPIPADDDEAWVEIKPCVDGFYVENGLGMLLAAAATPDAAYHAAVCKVEGWELVHISPGHEEVLLAQEGENDRWERTRVAVGPDPLTALRAAKEAKEKV